MTERPLTVACSADARFELPLGVLLYSLLKNNVSLHDIRIYVLDGGISSNARSWLATLCSHYGRSIHFVEPNVRTFAGVRVSTQFPISSWFRVLIPHLLPRDAEKVLYLDSDILVTRELETLWRTELGNFAFAACLSSLGQIRNSLIHKSQALTSFGESPYFNAGVLLMNSEQMLRDGIPQRALAFGRRFPELTVWEDQDALNAVSVGKWMLIDSRWNFLVRDIADAPFRLDPNAVLHFLGPDKPWHKTSETIRSHAIESAHLIYREYLHELKQLLSCLRRANNTQ